MMRIFMLAKSVESRCQFSPGWTTFGLTWYWNISPSGCGAVPSIRALGRLFDDLDKLRNIERLGQVLAHAGIPQPLYLPTSSIRTDDDDWNPTRRFVGF